ncbi:MAG: SAM-dependent methyltransferase, partial [Cytophagales bacterium]|nr:SAM-dependent methyltransferase [Cytophagales bacterium]
DIYWSAEMMSAWEEIKRHPAVTLTVDLFHVGLVFFRRKQPKQHFTLRS